jgi:peptidoglycan/LPS O-acetylase OafA/YrhL
MAGERHGRLAHIDALRGIAAFLVVVQHGCKPIAQRMPASPLHDLLAGQWFDLGRLGVILFFLISGFVIPFSLREGQPLSRFAITRFFRLFPAFWLSIAVTVLALGFAQGASFPATQILANITMVPVLFHQTYVSGVYWTLFIELVFYAICALLFACGMLRNAGVILAVGLSCVIMPLVCIAGRAAGLHLPILYITAHLSFLFAGYLVRIAGERPHSRAGLYATILIVAALAEMPVLAMQPDHAFTISTPLGVLLAAAVAVAVFVLVNRRPFAPPAALAWLGAISYSVYLFHMPISELVERAVSPAGLGSAIGFMLLLLAGTTALAAIVYHLLEQPCITIGRRIVHARRETLAIDVAP